MGAGRSRPKGVTETQMQPLVLGAQVGVVETERGQRAGRLALEHDVGVGHEPAEAVGARRRSSRSSTTPRLDVL